MTLEEIRCLKSTWIMRDAASSSRSSFHLPFVLSQYAVRASDLGEGKQNIMLLLNGFLAALHTCPHLVHEACTRLLLRELISASGMAVLHDQCSMSQVISLTITCCALLCCSPRPFRLSRQFPSCLTWRNARVHACTTRSSITTTNIC